MLDFSQVKNILFGTAEASELIYEDLQDSIKSFNIDQLIELSVLPMPKGLRNDTMELINERNKMED